MMDALPRIVWHLDDPVADPALVPLYFVAKKAAEHVTVVLSGEGADEFFGGYTIYREPLSLAAVQRPARPDAAGPAGGLQGHPPGGEGQELPGARHHPDRGALLRQRPDLHRGGEAAAAAPLRPVGAVHRRHRPDLRRGRELDDVTKMQYVDLYTWLRGDILVKADRMSMAHSLELRVPFLDREVFDVAATIPVELKLPPRSDDTKYAMRQALRGGRAAGRSSTGKKLGFPTPTRVWLRGRDVRLGARHPGHLRRRRADRPGVRAAGCWRRTARGGRPLPQDLDGAGVLRLARHLRRAGTLDPGIQRNQSALLTKPVVGSMVA